MSQFDTAALHHPQFCLAAAILRSGSAIRLRALGDSMLPALWPGDILTVVPVPSSAIRAGEIVLCVQNQRFVIHRLTQAGSASGIADWVTRGDALPHPDPAVPAAAILGRVYSITRGRRMLAPRPLTPLSRTFAWILVRSDSLYKLVLRIHSLRQRFWTHRGIPTGQREFLPSPMAQ